MHVCRACEGQKVAERRHDGDNDFQLLRAYANEFAIPNCDQFQAHQRAVCQHKLSGVLRQLELLVQCSAGNFSHVGTFG